MAERSAKWEPVDDIAWPCADISFRTEKQRSVHVLMNFSHTKGAPALNLELCFFGSVALRWVDESYAYGSVLGLDNAPVLNAFGRSWTFPLLKVVESSWLPSLGHATHVLTLEHYLLVAMNDIVQIAAKPGATARWVPSP